MLFILIIVLAVIAIILSVLKRKSVVTIKFNGKKIIFILLIFILLFGCLKIFVKIHDIIFFFQSLEYKNVDNYDYSNDITNNGYISKEGAIKIAKEKTNKKRIAKVTCELVENGTYINSDDVFKDIKDTFDKTSDTSNNKATFWLITLTTGWDYLCGHEEKWDFKIDYYTGKILQWDITM